jgi:hypothetical protein
MACAVPREAYARAPHRCRKPTAMSPRRLPRRAPVARALGAERRRDHRATAPAQARERNDRGVRPRPGPRGADAVPSFETRLPRVSRCLPRIRLRRRRTTRLRRTSRRCTTSCCHRRRSALPRRSARSGGLRDAHRGARRRRTTRCRRRRPTSCCRSCCSPRRRRRRRRCARRDAGRAGGCRCARSSRPARRSRRRRRSVPVRRGRSQRHPPSFSPVDRAGRGARHGPARRPPSAAPLSV